MNARILLFLVLAANNTVAAPLTNEVGQGVARDLQELYQNIPSNCHPGNSRLDTCSGVIVRGLNASENIKFYNPSATSVAVGSQSFSFLRADSNFRSLNKNYTHGYILRSSPTAIPGKLNLNLLCFFPIDGDSNGRADSGCGVHRDSPVVSELCDKQGITTGEGWRAHYTENGSTYAGRCAFDLRNFATANSNFYQGLRAGQLVTPKAFETPNGLKIKNWPQDVAKQLPVKAFFYLNNTSGLKGAEIEQRQFFEATGEMVPTVNLTLASLPSGKALFAYHAADQLPYAFKMVEAIDGTLNVDKLIGDNATVHVTYPGNAKGDTVRVRLQGVGVRDTELKIVTTPGIQSFLIPRAWLIENKGRSVGLTFTEKPGGTGEAITSQTLNIMVVGNTGSRVAEVINSRYRSTPASCGGNPLFYCSGVIIRATKSSDKYDSWDPSPQAEVLGAVSFSFMRLDAHVNSLYHNSGFIFMNPDEAIPRRKVMNYLCIYAWDGATLIAGRPDKGCGFKLGALAGPDLSTCSSKGVRTPAQWYEFTKTIRNEQYQCSLSAIDPVQFATSLTVRASKPANFKEFWNELLVDVWPQSFGRSLPIEAFFHRADVPTSLSEAKAYQIKFKNITGLWVPILKVDFGQINGNPFSFSEVDQAVSS